MKKNLLKVLSLMLALIMLLGMFAGCAKQEEAPAEEKKEEASAPAKEEEKKEEAPAEEKEEEEAPVEKEELSLSLFTGGYAGVWDELLPLFQEAYPQYELVTDIAADNHERLRANLVAGTPPDVAFPNPGDFNLYTAAFSSGQFLDLKELVYDQPVEWDEGKTYADLFVEGDLALVTDPEGHMYLGLSNYSLQGWWYDKALFREKGWELPSTWDEFLALAEDIKAEGIAPLTYQGLHPAYLTWGYLCQAVAAAGEGRETFCDAFYAQEDGVWESDAALQAVTQLYELAQNDGILKGTTALTHTEAQMEFLNGSVAFIPCGQWFENEMLNSLPEDFEMGFFPVPVQNANGENYICKQQTFIGIPADAKNPEGAANFIKFLYTPEAQQILAKYGMIPFNKEVDAEAMSMFTPVVQECINVATGNDPQFSTLGYVENVNEQLFPTLWSVIGDNLTLLVLGEIEPADFCAAVEAECDRIRADDTIAKMEVH